MGLKVGSVMMLEDVFYVVLVSFVNEVFVVMVEIVVGSEEVFVVCMNVVVEWFGLLVIWFVNVNGLFSLV